MTEGSKSEKSSDQEKTNWLPLILVVLAVIAIWYFFGIFASQQKDPGAYGDMHGAVNALFSGLAFVGVIFAIILQKKELELQRKELQETQKIQENQRLEFEKQNHTIAKQRFENTFFQLVENCKINLDEFKYGPLNGIDGIQKGLDELLSAIRRSVKDSQNVTAAIDAYSGFYKERIRLFRRYYSNIERIIDFIASSEVEDKGFYYQVLMENIPSQFLTFFFYHTLSPFVKIEYEEIIVRYGLFKSLPREMLAYPEHSRGYSANAFGA